MPKRVILVCEVCKQRNYTTTKHKQTERIEIKKFCGRCNKHIIHRETK